MFSMQVDQAPKDQYCNWQFDLSPSNKYLIHIKRELPATEVIELEIKGQGGKYEFIEDYRLQYDE